MARKTKVERVNVLTPILLITYGLPGAGKTYFSRQLADNLDLVHLEQDRIRSELFNSPTFSKQENSALMRVTSYMAHQFLKSGISVILDMDAIRYSQRHMLRELARSNDAKPIVIWLQIDPDTAYARLQSRNPDNDDDEYAMNYNEDSFRRFAEFMQNPQPTEDYLVTSGKHHFKNQLSTTVRKLSEMQIIKSSQAVKKMVKPSMTNLVPTALKDLPKVQKRNKIVLR